MAASAHALSAAVVTSSGLDDPARIDTIRALEQLVCVATAVQAALAASSTSCSGPSRRPRVYRSRSRVAGSRRRWRSRVGSPITAAGVTWVWPRSSRPAAAHLGGLAGRADHRVEGHLIARETACLTREDRVAVDAAVWRRRHPGGGGWAIASWRWPASGRPTGSIRSPTWTRRRKAEADRNVTLRPAPDAMTWLTALLPVKDGVAAYAALTRTADSARAAGDARGKGQMMADTLVGSVLGAAAERHDDQTRWEASADQPTSDEAGAIQVSVGLVMTDAALFGASDEPAHVDGYGPIPAVLAREIVAGACARNEKLWLRRLYTSPTTGELVAMDSRGPALPQQPGAVHQAAGPDLPHPVVRRADPAIRPPDGRRPRAARPTRPNGQGLCEACNHAKQAPGWRARPSPTAGPHQIDTMTPTGHSDRSTAPPVVAVIHESPVRLDLYVAS